METYGKVLNMDKEGGMKLVKLKVMVAGHNQPPKENEGFILELSGYRASSNSSSS